MIKQCMPPLYVKFRTFAYTTKIATFLLHLIFVTVRKINSQHLTSSCPLLRFKKPLSTKV